MESEIYIPVQGFNKYEISNMGNVRNKTTGRILKYFVNKKKGYHSIGLIDENKKHHTFLIHRLVALHFVPNPKNHTRIEHIDGYNKTNIASNLRWFTPSQYQHQLKEEEYKRNHQSENI